MSRPEALAQLSASGLDPLPTGLALGALDRVLAADRASAVVVLARWPVLAGLARARGQGALFSRLAPEDAPPVEAPAPVASPRLLQIRAAPPDEARRLLTELLADEICAALGHRDRSAVPPGRGFVDLGLDSLMAVQLVTRLKALLGLSSLPATLIYEQPNLSALSRFLADEVLRLPAPPAPEEVEETEEQLEARLAALLQSL